MPRKVKLNAYNCTIHFYRGDEAKQYESHYDSRISPKQHGQQCGNGVFINTVCEDRQFCITRAIVHECSHAVDWIFHDRLNMEATSYELSEIRAYTLDYIVSECMKHCKPKGRQ
jgi:hypothetical protein